MKNMNGEVRNAVKAGFPIFIGYIPPAIAFGVLAKTCDITLFECFLFSAAFAVPCRAPGPAAQYAAR